MWLHVVHGRTQTPDNLFARNSKTMVVYAALCRSMSYRSDTFSMRIFLPQWRFLICSYLYNFSLFQFPAAVSLRLLSPTPG
jgi:hypothetical protein